MLRALPADAFIAHDATPPVQTAVPSHDTEHTDNASITVAVPDLIPPVKNDDDAMLFVEDYDRTVWTVSDKHKRSDYLRDHRACRGGAVVVLSRSMQPCPTPAVAHDRV